MKRMLLSAVAILFAASAVCAEDGASLYKSKCAGCHGLDGQGKSGPKIAAINEQRVIDVLTKGGQPKAPHIKHMSHVSSHQAKQIAEYVQSLK
jgi:mono/diheme cytochrome c family protein